MGLNRGYPPTLHWRDSFQKIQSDYPQVSMNMRLREIIQLVIEISRGSNLKSFVKLKRQTGFVPTGAIPIMDARLAAANWNGQAAKIRTRAIVV